MQMAVASHSSPIRVALVDDDSGFVTVMDKRFAALKWQRELLTYGPGPDQLAAMKLAALVLNPSLDGPRLHRADRDPPSGPRAARRRRAGPRRRSGARPARRRGRLGHEALPSRGAGRPDPGRPAPPPRGRAAGRGRGAERRGARDPAGPVRRVCRTGARRTVASRVRAAAPACRRGRVACSSGSISTSACGATRWPAATAPWTSSSAS